MRPIKPGAISSAYLAHYYRIQLESLAQLIISPDRVQEIQRQWPPPQDRFKVTREEVLFPITLSANRT